MKDIKVGHPSTPNPNYEYFDFVTNIPADFTERAHLESIDLNFDAEAFTLPSGQQATVERWLDTENTVHLRFGIPKGDTGDSGVYIGTEEPTDPNIKVWIDPTAGVNAYNSEEIDEFIRQIQETFATKVWVEAQGYIPDAPSDDRIWGRKNGTWVVVTGGGGGATTWDELEGKPFNQIGSNLTVVDGKLTVETTDLAQEDNTKPITSAGTYVILGNIEVLLGRV